jgi:sulfhydrogenase subunit beta (sulfur reductase)
MNKSITINNIPRYIEHLSHDYMVYFPVKNGHEISFTNDKTRTADFHWGLPQIPPKEFFLPSEEIINEFENNSKKAKLKQSKKIIFGMHPLDIRALSILKIIYSKNPDDPFYKNISQYIIIGMGDFIFDNLFDFDIFFESNGDTYDIILKNPDCTSLLSYKNLFQEKSFVKEKIVYEHDPLFADTHKLSNVIEESYSHPIWDELAQIDLSCGNCTYTCPLCYCFETHDQLDLNCTTCANRSRRWSTCYQSDFFEISGHNFRPKLRDRIYNWYHHKFVRMPREIGHIGCVDCGRCIRYCPAKINFKTVLKTLLDDYDKKH